MDHAQFFRLCWGRRHIFLPQWALTVHGVCVWYMLCGHSKLTITVLYGHVCGCIIMIGGVKILSATSDLIKFYKRARDMTSFRSRHTHTKKTHTQRGWVLLSAFVICDDCQWRRRSKYQSQWFKFNSQMTWMEICNGIVKPNASILIIYRPVHPFCTFICAFTIFI